MINKKNNGNKKIAIFLPSLQGGGAERVTVTLANGIAEKGVGVDLIVANASGAYRDQVSPEVHLIDLKLSRVLYALPKLVRYFKNEKPSAMLSVLNYANVIAILAKKLASSDAKLVIAEHNNASTAVNIGFIASKIPKLMRRLYPYANKIVAVSAGVAEDLCNYLSLKPNSVNVIYNPVNVDSHLMPLQEPVHPWFMKGEQPVIIGVGRLTEQKDFATLIKAFAKVCIKSRVRLVILGEGELRADLEKLVELLEIKEYVLMPGFVDNPYEWMRQSSLFVLSSAWEGLPTVLIEAMGCGIPVISTNCPSGPLEILQNGKYGSLVPVGDSDQLAIEILKVLNGNVFPDVISRANDFNIDKSVLAYLKILSID